MKPKVLIICFTFPPYPGVGGRRWAKFAKYLHRKQWDVFVIAAQKQLTQNSPWTSDTDDYKNHISYIPSSYPLILTGVPKTIWQKIRYRIALYYAKLFAHGNYYDHSSFWKKQILKATETKIKEGYNNIIVSCGPFKTAGFVIELKIKYPHVRFIVDFRDPWTNNKTSFGYTSISPQRLAAEQNMEKYTVQNYDYILSVSDQMNDYFHTLSGNRERDRFINIINGFDRDDFPEKTFKGNHSGKLRLIFTGTLYDKSMHVFTEFCNVLRQLSETDETVYNHLQIDFYGHVPVAFKTLTKGLDIIKYRGEVSIQEVYRQIASSHLAMLFMTDDMNYSFSTKFYEYISQEIPIAVFASSGHTGEFIETNGVGYACFSGNMEKALLQIHQDWVNGALRFNPVFDTRRFDVEQITDNLISILKHK
jgi:glycosyltransferase involved in cell wall biosynthesis